MSLEDYQTIYQPLFSRSAKIVIAVLAALFLLVPFNSRPLEERLYQGAATFYSDAVNSPQELIDTYLIKKLNLHLTYRETDPALILEKRQRQAWLLRNWLFWGPFCVFVFPLALLLSIGFMRKVKASIARSRLLESYQGTLLWGIRDKVRRVSWRVNFFNWEKGFIHVLVIGLVLFIGQFAAGFFLSISREAMRSLLLSFLIYTAALYVFYLYYNRFSERRVAGIIDARMGLKERLVTSWDEPREPTPLYWIVLEETSQQLSRQNAGTLAPHRFPRPSKRGFMGMLLSTLILAVLISVATPHAAVVVRSYRDYVRKISPARDKDEAEELRKVVQQEGEKLKELVDEFESDSDDVKFSLEETRRLAVKMISFEVEKQDFFINPPQNSDSQAISPDTLDEDEEKKEAPEKRNQEQEKNIRVSQTPLSIKAYQHQKRDEHNFSKISKELSKIAMEMFREGKSLPSKSSSSKRRESFLRKNLINNTQRNEDIQDNADGGETDDGDSKSEDADSDDSSMESSSFWEADNNAFSDQQKNSGSDTFSLESPSKTEQGKTRIQDQKIDMETLKALMKNIFNPAKEQPQASKENLGQSQKQESALTKNDESATIEDSMDNLLDQMPSLSRQEQLQQVRQESSKKQKTNPAHASSQRQDKASKKNKKKKAMPESRDQRKTRDFSKTRRKKKDLISIDSPRDIEIVKEDFDVTPDAMEDWFKDSQELGNFDSLPLKGDGERRKVLGKRVDLLSKSMVVVKNPSNVANPRQEMRDAVASVENPNYIQGLPKKLSRFVKDVTDPKKIEVFTSQLNKLGKDLDDWERASTPKKAQNRTGMSQQKAIGTDANWSDDEVEMGGSNPKSNKSAAVIRGSKKGRGPDSDSKKFRIEKFPEHVDPHKNMDNISQDLANLGRELTDMDNIQRQALLGRMEASGDSPNTDRSIKRNKLKEQLSEKGKRFEGLSRNIKPDSDPSTLKALSKKNIDQSRNLGNMFMGRPGARSSPKADNRVKSTLKENKKSLQQMSEKLRDTDLSDQGAADKFSSELSRMASKTRELADQQGLSESKDPVADDVVKKALRQKADSIEQLTEDLRKRYPKGNSDMARRFSSLAKEMENIDQAQEMGKATGNGGGAGMALKSRPDKGGRDKHLSEQIQQTGNQLQKLSREANNKDLNLDKLVRGINKSSKQLDRLLNQNKNMQQQYASQIADVSGKLDMIRKELKGMGKSDPQDNSNKVKEYVEKQKKQLNNINRQIKQDKLGQAAKELRELSKEMGRKATQSRKSLSENANSQLDRTASQIKKLAGDLQKEAEKKKPRVSDVLKAAEEAMQQTMKEMEKTNNTDSDDPDQSRRQAKKMAALSLDMGKLSRLQSSLGKDRSASRQQQKTIRDTQAQLKELSEKLQQQTDTAEIKKLSRKAQQLSKTLTTLPQKSSEQKKSSRWLEKMAKKLKKNNDLDTARKLSLGLGKMMQQSSRDRLDVPRKLSQTKEDLDKQIKKIERDRQRQEEESSSKEKERAELSREIQKLSSEIQQEESSKKIEQLSSQLSGLAKRLADQLPDNTKKSSSKLDEPPTKSAELSMNMNKGLGKRNLQEGVQETIRDVGDSLKEITERLNENIDRDKISSDLTDLSQELSNLDLGGERKVDSDEDIRDSDKKIINETGNKLKELADKAITQKNPKDIRQMATDLIRLSGNLKNLDLGKSEQQGDKSTSNVSGKNRKYRANKLKMLAQKLKGAKRKSDKKKIASQMSKLVASIGPKDAQRSFKTAGKDKDNRKGNSGSFFKKILDLPQFFRKDKEIKEKKNKSTKERDKNDLSRTAAVNKIDKLIKKLKRRKKKLPGTYNSKRVLKKAGISSKGAGSIQKGIVGKMTRSNYSKTKFTDSNVSKDVNVLPDADIVNNTYVMEQNLTDRQVFERLIKRLEKNREHILAEGKDPDQVMPSDKLPLSKDLKKQTLKSAKQPTLGDDGRMMAGLGAPDTVVIPGDPPAQDGTEKVSDQSFMDKQENSKFLKMPLKLDKKKISNLPLDQLNKTRGRKSYRLNTSQANDDSIIDQIVPGEYKDIIKELFSRTTASPQSVPDATSPDN